ncbi:MAG TPA: hypothetical protein VFV75_15765 [Candidatus Polarisedimenticolaceae bacterium]|nr:hypothetical protein [Candidatus Polarisedimenticolaceae bacterium]
MKTLGGVGAVVMGAMLLLTVKIGPAEPQPASSTFAKMHPLAAFAAVPEAPPRSTPAAAPVPGAATRPTTAERRVLVVVPRTGKDAPQGRKDALQIQVPRAFECSFELELPANFSAL